MTDAYLHVSGRPLTKVVLHVPPSGVLFADVDFVEVPDVTGRVELVVGDLTISGTIRPSTNGAHVLQRKCRIVGGAGAWGEALAAKSYHNDAGVKARTVADDAAREAGETLGTFAPNAERVGVDYLRQSGPASRVLEDVIGGAQWWVDYAGLTHVGARTTSTPKPDTYEVLNFDPRSRVATIAVNSFAAIGVGSILTERLDAPQTIRDLEITLEGRSATVLAWCGDNVVGEGRLPGLLRTIFERLNDGKLWGKYKYRVYSMAPDGRVNLQIVNKATGLPDALPVSMWPGVAGAHAELAPGGEVLVEFIDGDRTQPIVTHFAGKTGVGHVPVSVALAGGTRLASAVGDTASVIFPGSVPFAGTYLGNPISGVLDMSLTEGIAVLEQGANGKVTVP